MFARMVVNALCFLVTLVVAANASFMARPPSRVSFHHGTRASLIRTCGDEEAMDIRNEGNTATTTRRVLLLTSIVAAGVSFYPQRSIANAEEGDDDDPIAAFGKALKAQSEELSASFSSRWPASPSPLPTITKTAEELTSRFTPLNSLLDNNDADEPERNDTNLEQSLQEKSSKRRVDPRTHG